MDESLLEEKFRKRLDAAIPITETSKAGPSSTTMAVGLSAKESRTTTVTNPIDSEVVDKQKVATRKLRQDLYHSSYSPTEFSDVEDQDDNEDDNEDEDEDEGQDTVELKRHDINDKDNDQSQPPPPQTQSTSLQTQVREGLWESNTLAHRHRVPSNPIQIKESRDNNPRRDSGDISFEREVALARAKRELRASLNRTGGQRPSDQANPDGIPSDVNHSNAPSSPVLSVSRLDRGRDLALEDLVSPTRFIFGSRHSSQQHQYDPTAPAGFSSAAPAASGHNWQSAPTFPLLSTAEDLAQLDIATGAEERFLEMAGAFGEGQAVASIFGTLKGMIRQVKTEKKLLEKANQKLQKELRKTRRDLERSRKANEKMQKVDHATQSSSHTKPGRGDKDREAESISAQQEKDKIARNMVAFQKRIDALERQRAELQVREQLRAKEEANLMLLIDSDDDSQQGEGAVESESESGSESVESAGDHAKDDKMPRQIQSVCSDSEHSIMQRPHGQRGLGASRRPSAKAPVASSSRAASSKFKEEQEYSGTSGSRTKSGRKKARSKSAHHLELRQFVDKVEEVVHIHHHVYYGDDDQHDDPSPISRSRSVDASRRSAAAPLRNVTHSEYGEPSEGQYYFRPRTGRDIDDQPRHQPLGQNAVPQRVSEPSHTSYDGDTHSFRNRGLHHSPMTAVQQNGAPVQPFQRSQFPYNDLARPEPEQLPIPPRSRVVTIVDGGEENARYGTTASRAFTVSQGVAFHELGIPLSFQRRSTAVPVSPEGSESSSCTESNSDAYDTPDVDDGESQELPYPIRQRSSAATTTTAQKPGPAKNADSSGSSEQKLHVVLRELEEEVRHLRKSYFELHHDLETIGQKSVGDFAVDSKGKGRSLNGGVSSTTAVTGPLAVETAAAEQRRQQKKLIREQLLKVVDSLGEKTDEIMRLQEQQEQRLQNKSNNSKKTLRSVQCLRTSTSGTRNDTRRSDKDRHEKNDPHDDTTTATSKRGLDNEQEAHEEDGQQATAEQDKDQDTDTSDSQGTARPRQRHPDQKNRASGMEQGKAQRSQSKEPEGYRHRLANGFRVPKLH
ncbi:hypothetical protein BGZ70_008949 [Mortierella alpina]|uniref:Uncharacterized protein n=1 Tax=Mortierella alpina TaxID=64518 RepID=A0A9P6J2A6_MORAP|nr:hypothetical protein BGZ70_008949 [Mortierella alpina]